MIPSDADYDLGARVAASCARPGVDVEDLRQIGRIAVWRASQEFDASRGVPWHYWAWRWANMAARSYCRRPTREIAMEAGLEGLTEPDELGNPTLDLLLPSVRELALDARVVVLLLLCGCTARQIAIRLEWRYSDVLEVRRDALFELREDIEALGVTHV